MDGLISRKEAIKAIEEMAMKRMADINHNYMQGFRDAEEALIGVPPKMQWVPVIGGDGIMPEVDEEGFSRDVLLSFSNCSILVIGQYREDEDGGSFYDGDDSEPLTAMGLYVNAWMPLPDPYREGGKDDERFD